jgi:hypothetical protein
MPYLSLALPLELAAVGHTAVLRHVFEDSAEVAEADAGVTPRAISVDWRLAVRHPRAIASCAWKRCQRCA